MNNSVKVLLYAVLAVLAGISGYFALTNFGRLMARAGERNSALEQIEPERKQTPDTAETPSPSSQSRSSETTLTNVPAPATTNVSTALTNAAVTNLALASSAQSTNATAETKVVSTSTEQSPVAHSTLANAGTKPTDKGSGRVGLWTALFVVSLIALGLLIAGDVSHYLGNRALKTLYNDEGEGQQNPEYDKAEEVWANGDYLEAIRMMREYLTQNPREQHVAIRIAEIYEKDLKNNLAAALEYEEVLKHKLPPERWGWSAIHLCNLYFHLNHEQKGFDLLRRIVKEYPGTAAAEKARKRLEQVEGAPPEEITAEQQVLTAPPPKTISAKPAPASNLPPGFRPKK